MSVIDTSTFARLVERAQELGLPRLGVVRIDHRGFSRAVAAFDRFMEAGRQGEMGFLERGAAARRDPQQMLPGARSLLVVAVPYRGVAGPVARYAQTADYHTELYQRLSHLVESLHAWVPGVHSIICVDTKPIFERTAAALAKLGFIGKHGCVIVPQLGSYVFLGAVLTTASWADRDEAWDPSRSIWEACGQCTRCLDACPTQAFVAPGELDPRRCISYLTLEHRGAIADELSDRMGERIAGCDVCQEVCPYNAGVARETRVEAHVWVAPPNGHNSEVDLVRLIDLGSAGYRRWVKHTPLRRVPRASMARNALLALSNGEGTLSADVLARVTKLLDHPHPEVVRSARRVLARRG